LAICTQVCVLPDGPGPLQNQVIGLPGTYIAGIKAWVDAYRIAIGY
jgi:hypothetical protein